MSELPKKRTQAKRKPVNTPALEDPVISVIPRTELPPRTKLEICKAMHDAGVKMAYDKGEKDPEAIIWVKDNCTRIEWDNMYKGRTIPI